MKWKRRIKLLLKEENFYMKMRGIKWESDLQNKHECLKFTSIKTFKDELQNQWFILFCHRQTELYKAQDPNWLLRIWRNHLSFHLSEQRRIKTIWLISENNLWLMLKRIKFQSMGNDNSLINLLLKFNTL